MRRCLFSGRPSGADVVEETSRVKPEFVNQTRFNSSTVTKGELVAAFSVQVIIRMGDFQNRHGIDQPAKPNFALDELNLNDIIGRTEPAAVKRSVDCELELESNALAVVVQIPSMHRHLRLSCGHTLVQRLAEVQNRIALLLPEGNE